MNPTMGLVERDYVMRMVKQIAELLARAMGLKGQKKDQEAAEVLEAGCLELLGIDWKTLAWSDSASAAQLLREPVKIRMFAQLMEHRAQFHEDAGQAADARSKFQHAYELYRESGKHAEAIAGAERCAAKFDLGLLPEKYRA